MSAETHTPDLSGPRNKALFLGLLGVAAGIYGLTSDSHQFLQSYLIAFIYWTMIPVTCIALLCIHHLVGGQWGVVIRRLLESGTRTLPLSILFAIPILMNIPTLYEWARPEAAHDKILQHKAPYLNVTFFITRMVIYFAIWSIVGYFMNRWSAEQENGGGEEAKNKLRSLSGPGLVLHIATVTFFAFDIGMSLEPHWQSTMYGVIYAVGGALATMAFIIIVLKTVSSEEPLHSLIKPNHFHDLGTLMFAFVCLWAYTNFSQFLIIWSGNLPEETPYYVKRFQGAWNTHALILMALHFFLPFFLLLVRFNKKKAQLLATIAAFMMVMRLADLIWLIAPAFQHGTGHEVHYFHWLDVALPIGLGGIWAGFYFYQLGRRSLVPVEVARLATGGHH